MEIVRSSVLPMNVQEDILSGKWTHELRSGERSAWGCKVGVVNLQMKP